MATFTAVIRLSHNPHKAFVLKRGWFVELSPTTRYSKDDLERMPTYHACLPQYNYIYSMGHTFHTLDEIDVYVNV
jgi:hypothetical protein